MSSTKFNSERVESEVKQPIVDMKEEVITMMSDLKDKLSECIGTDVDDASLCWAGETGPAFFEKFSELQDEIKTNYEAFIEGVEQAIKSHGDNVSELESTKF